MRPIAVILAAQVFLAGGVGAIDESSVSSVLLVPQQVVEIKGLLTVGGTSWVALKSNSDDFRYLLSAGQSTGAVEVKRVTAHHAFVSVHDDAFELEPGDLLIILTLFDAHSATPRLDRRALLLDRVSMIGIVGAVGQTQSAFLPNVILRNYASGSKSIIVQGESAFGYEAKSITTRAAVLKTTDSATAPAVGGDDRRPPEAIPNLVGMSLPQRERWVTEWRQNLALLPDAEQDRERQRMREYWRLQAVGGWGKAVSAILEADEQTRLREEISAYWRP